MVIALPDSIRRVAVVDDDPRSRDAMAETIRDAQLEPVKQELPLDSIDEFIASLERNANAVLCDHHLAPGNYASFHGAKAVAALYARGFPALLVTRWSVADMDGIRPYRRQIPSILKSGELYPEQIRKGISECMSEFKNEFVKERRPWRVLVRVEDVSNGLVFVIVPSWNTDEVIRLPRGIFPEGQPLPAGTRLFAEVNIGARNVEELFFVDFEAPKVS
ncbi:MAG: hypothetical protein NTU41_12200 [Chloroflexi bacterium]|nr:hypothetical protein [Chloroflexota bacterium]